MRVDRRFRVFHNARYPFIDVRQPMEELTESVEISDDDPFILHPGEFVLGQTLERVRLPDDIVARLEGKSSSLGRLGLLIHSTAGFVDPGFEGNLTLELSNVANLPVTIYYGMPIGQISFMRMDAAGRAPLRLGRGGQQVPGPGGAHAEPLPPELQAVAAGVDTICPDAKRGTPRAGDRPHHRPGDLRAEAPAGAGTLGGPRASASSGPRSRARATTRKSRRSPLRSRVRRSPASPSRARS